MITKAEYTIDGNTKDLKRESPSTWKDTSKAPEKYGRYPATIALENGAGQRTEISSSDPRFNVTLVVESKNDLKFDMLELLPEYLQDIKEFKLIMETETQKFNDLYTNMDRSVEAHLIDSMPVEILTRFETFLGIVGEGTIEQRRAYIKALYTKGDKLSETSIKAVVKSITGGKAVVKFFAGGDALNPTPGQGTLRVQVLSPDPNVNYKFDDIIRALAPYMPAHIKLDLIRYFSTWEDIKQAYISWENIMGQENWQTLYNYIPPQIEL